MTANNQDFTLAAECPANPVPVIGVGSTALLGSVSFYAVEWRESNRVRVYATGRFIATLPPIPKVGPIETAKKWKTAKGASAWMNRHAADHGCRVVLLPNDAISQPDAKPTNT